MGVFDSLSLDALRAEMKDRFDRAEKEVAILKDSLRRAEQRIDLLEIKMEQEDR